MPSRFQTLFCFRDEFRNSHVVFSPTLHRVRGELHDESDAERGGGGAAAAAVPSDAPPDRAPHQLHSVRLPPRHRQPVVRSDPPLACNAAAVQRVGERGVLPGVRGLRWHLERPQQLRELRRLLQEPGSGAYSRLLSSVLCSIPGSCSSLVTCWAARSDHAAATDPYIRVLLADTGVLWLLAHAHTIATHTDVCHRLQVQGRAGTCGVILSVNSSDCGLAGTFRSLANCRNAACNTYCEADGECGTSNRRDNCNGADDDGWDSAFSFLLCFCPPLLACVAGCSLARVSPPVFT